MGRGRPAEVFVRRLKPKEGRAVRRIVRRGKKDASPVTWRRALVVLMSAQRRSPAEIADAIDAKEGWVRGIIHAFNDAGIDALRPKWRGGRPRSITEDMRARIVEVAKTAPQLVGDPYTHWSLSKLASYLVKAGIVPTISKERLREILIEEGFSIQRTKTWKWSPDPEFDAKQKRLERLYERAVKGTLDGVVVSFDEHGPVQPIPQGGTSVGEEREAQAHPRQLQKASWGALLLRCLRRGKRPAHRTMVEEQERDQCALLLQMDPPPLPSAGAHLPRHGQPVLALDRRRQVVGEGQQRRACRDPDIRVMAQPDRVSVRSHGRLRVLGFQLPGPQRD